MNSLWCVCVYVVRKKLNLCFCGFNDDFETDSLRLTTKQFVCFGRVFIEMIKVGEILMIYVSNEIKNHYKKSHFLFCKLWKSN